MKSLKIFLIIPVSFLAACTKDNNPAGTATLTVVNAVVGSNPLATNFTGTDSISYKRVRKLNYGSYASGTNWFGSYSGTVKLGLYQYPDTFSHSHPLFNLTLDLPINSIHTLFLTGTVTSSDTLFTTDILPYHADSVVGVRFVNLSPGSNPVNVTLSTSTTVNEINNLSYKSTTPFKNYAVVASISSYTFQFRDAATNTILASYTMSGVNNGSVNNNQNVLRYNNVTVALYGNQPAGYRTMLINNY